MPTLGSGAIAIALIVLETTVPCLCHAADGERRNAERRADQRAERKNEGATGDSAASTLSEEDRRVEILTLGEGSERFWVAFGDERISIWTNRMPADKLLKELEAYGGPTFTCFERLTRPVTLSLVGVRMEDVLRKILDAYNFAYYYEDGRLAHVRILNFIPGRNYKVGDPVTTRDDWTAQVIALTDP